MMSNSNRRNLPRKLPTWVLWIGLLGIVNFLVSCWFLFPPSEGKRVYFWFAEFYGYMFFPSLVFLALSIIIVVLWFSRFMEKSLAKAVALLVGIVVAAVCFMQAFTIAAFLSTLRVIGRVSQNHNFYFLVKHYDDAGTIYSFCESDAIGFSGTCRDIGWKSDDSNPRIYIEQSTNLVTVESENPSFIWQNSVPPSCRIDLDESNNEEEYPIYVVECIP